MERHEDKDHGADEAVSEVMTISEAAHRLHISPSALRYYEDQGLITPVRSEESGYRLYSAISVLELSDIILYRNLGLPVKSIKRLMNAPVEQSLDALDKVYGDTMAQVRALNRKLELLYERNRRIRRYLVAKTSVDHLVPRPGISHLYPVNIYSEDHMATYLDHAEEDCYGAYFGDADRPERFVDCETTLRASRAGVPVWEYVDDGHQWMECLLTCDYGLTQNNDLATHVAHMRQRGLGAGRVVAEYLTFDWSEVERRRFDFYLAWIEVL